MKRALITLIFIVFSLSALAQGRYVVYDCGQGARIFRNESRSWDDIKKGETLQENTLLHIRRQGLVKILDKTTNRVYSNVKTGRQSVSSLIQASSKSANSTFGNLNRQLARNVRNSDHRGRYYSTYGATTRGDGEVSFADSLYYSIFHGISNQAFANQLRLDEILNNDGTVSFSVTNESDESYYVTVVSGDSSHLTFCFDDSLYGVDVIPVLPHSTADLRSYKFVVPSGNDSYYLIAAQREFWTEPLKNALRYMVAPDYSADAELVKVIPAK